MWLAPPHTMTARSCLPPRGTAEDTYTSEVHIRSTRAPAHMKANQTHRYTGKRTGTLANAQSHRQRETYGGRHAHRHTNTHTYTQADTDAKS